MFGGHKFKARSVDQEKQQELLNYLKKTVSVRLEFAMLKGQVLREIPNISINNKADLLSHMRISKLALRLVNSVARGPRFLPSFHFAKLRGSVLSLVTHLVHKMALQFQVLQ